MLEVTISKKEYQNLIERAFRYDYLRQILQEDIFSSPPTRNAGTIIKEFHSTKRYSQKFLRSLVKGLKRSSYFRQ